MTFWLMLNQWMFDCVPLGELPNDYTWNVWNLFSQEFLYPDIVDRLLEIIWV